MSALDQFFVPHVEKYLAQYTENHELLEAADGGGGNRRTVAKAVESQFANEANTNLINQFVARLVKQATPRDENDNPVGPMDPGHLFYLWNTLGKAFDDSKAGKEVETFVTGEVEKLKANKTVSITDEQRTQARVAIEDAFAQLTTARDMINLSRASFDQAEVDALLAKIEAANLTKPRKVSGPTGPRLRPADGGKYEFYINSAKVSENLRKLAEVHGVDQATVKADIAQQMHEAGHISDLTSEMVKAWFNSAPNNFTFNLTDDKGNVHEVRAVRAAVKAKDAGEDSSDDEDENGDED